MDAVLTLAALRREEGPAEDLRGGPTAAAAGPQAGAEAAHQRELVAHQQPRACFAMAWPLPAAPTRQVHARRFLLGHGHAG